MNSIYFARKFEIFYNFKTSTERIPFARPSHTPRFSKKTLPFYWKNIAIAFFAKMVCDGQKHINILILQ